MKAIIRIFCGDQSKVFNVKTSDDICLSDIMLIAKHYTKYNVIVTKGHKKHRGPSMSLRDTIEKIKKVKFYHYKEIPCIIPKFMVMSTFRVRPFVTEYNESIGATFFHLINDNIIVDPYTALNDLFSTSIYFSKNGYYYVWGEYEIRYNINTKCYELGIPSTEAKIKKIKVEI